MKRSSDLWSVGLFSTSMRTGINDWEKVDTCVQPPVEAPPEPRRR